MSADRHAGEHQPQQNVTQHLSETYLEKMLPTAATSNSSRVPALCRLMIELKSRKSQGVLLLAGACGKPQDYQSHFFWTLRWCVCVFGEVNAGHNRVLTSSSVDADPPKLISSHQIIKLQLYHNYVRGVKPLGSFQFLTPQAIIWISIAQLLILDNYPLPWACFYTCPSHMSITRPFLKDPHFPTLKVFRKKIAQQKNIKLLQRVGFNFIKCT